MNSLQTFKLTHYYVGYSHAFSPPVSWTTPEDQTGVRVPTVFASLPLRFVGMLQSLSPFSRSAIRWGLQQNFHVQLSAHVGHNKKKGTVF